MPLLNSKKKTDEAPKYFPKKNKPILAPKVYPDVINIGGLNYYEKVNPRSSTEKYILVAHYKQLFAKRKNKKRQSKIVIAH